MEVTGLVHLLQQPLCLPSRWQGSTHPSSLHPDGSVQLQMQINNSLPLHNLVFSRTSSLAATKIKPHRTTINLMADNKNMLAPTSTKVLQSLLKAVLGWTSNRDTAGAQVTSNWQASSFRRTTTQILIVAIRITCSCKIVLLHNRVSRISLCCHRSNQISEKASSTSRLVLLPTTPRNSQVLLHYTTLRQTIRHFRSRSHNPRCPT